MAAIYWFARTADDLADEGSASAHERLNDLAQYRSELLNLHTEGQPSRWPEVMGPLRVEMARHRLPRRLLLDLLDAFEQDVIRTEAGAIYANHDELLEYCSRSANPIGRLLLHLYQVTSPLALEQSDQVCSALQLINFWQDLSVDIPRRRYYLPDDLCFAHRVNFEQITAQRDDAQSAALVQELVNRARALMLAGAPIVRQVPGRSGWELRLVIQGGLRILDKIEGMGCATLRQRPRLRAWDVPVLLWKALWM